MAMISTAYKNLAATAQGLAWLESESVKIRRQLSRDNSDEESPPRSRYSISSSQACLTNHWYNISSACSNTPDLLPDTQLNAENPIYTWLSMPNRVGSGALHLRRVHIHSVLIYAGHANKPQCGPYASSVSRVHEMFKELNTYRISKRLQEWKIIPLPGNEFMEALTFFNPVSTLLVFPAGESTNLDNSFTPEEKSEIQSFLYRGGRGYFTCGSAFWIVKKRRWCAPCASYPNASCNNPVEKESQIPLIDGEAVGPLCPLPNGMMHGAGFYSKAITVKYGNNKQCTVFLGGGGSFILKDNASALILTILAQLARPLEPLGKRAKLRSITPREVAPQSSALLDSFQFRKTPDNVISSNSPLFRRVESLPDVPNACKKVINTSSVSGSFRKVASMTELNQLPTKGCMSPPAKESSPQQIRVLVRYDFEELKKLGESQGKTPVEMKKLENAAVIARTGKGAVLGTKFHPYYDSTEMDAEKYTRQFPNSGTNWHDMIANLSPLHARIELFFFMMEALETFDFSGNSGVS